MPFPKSEHARRSGAYRQGKLIHLDPLESLEIRKLLFIPSKFPEFFITAS